MKKILLLAVLLAPLLASGCAKNQYYEPGYSRGGPPPHAPAHGYRHKHGNQNLVFDSGLGVYVVLDRPDHYFWDNRFYRYHRGDWQFADDLDGRWYRDEGYAPRKLYKSRSGADKNNYQKSPGKGKDKGNEKGKGKGKNDRGNSDRY